MNVPHAARCVPWSPLFPPSCALRPSVPLGVQNPFPPSPTDFQIWGLCQLPSTQCPPLAHPASTHARALTYTQRQPTRLLLPRRPKAADMAEQQQRPPPPPQATHFVVHYGLGLYAIFPAFAVNEGTFWLQHRWLQCAHCLEEMEVELALAEAANNGLGGGAVGGGGGGGPNAHCQCMMPCVRHPGGPCHAQRRNGSPFCSSCQVIGCPGIPGGPPCDRGRQGKTAMDRWSCNACGHSLGLRMRNEIGQALALLGQAREVVRVLVLVQAPADADPMEFAVKARFANALNGQMCTQEQMANHASPVVSNTRGWALSLMAGILPQSDAPSCTKIRVEEDAGQVVQVQVLRAQMGVNGWGVDVQQEDEGEAAEQP